MTDEYDLPNGNVRRRIAHDTAADTVPIGLTQEPDFDAWRLVVEDIADEIEHELEKAEP
jgi:hypothetical protein